jgi:hypothetical protein
MTKFYAVFLISILVFSACAKKQSEPAKNNTQLPDLEISINIPEGMEPVSPELLKEQQDASVDFPPIPPFTDFPCYQFVNSAASAVITFSDLTFTNSATSLLDPVTIMEDYRESLRLYYGVDSIAADEIISGGYKIMIMNFQYEPAGESVFLTKALYYRYPQHYFLIDFYFDAEKISPETLQDFDKMFQSITTIGR